MVQLDELQKQTVYQLLAPYNLEGYQQVVGLVITGDADARMILSLIRAIWEEGRQAGYQDGVRWGENYGSEVVLRFLKQKVNNRERDTIADTEPAKAGKT